MVARRRKYKAFTRVDAERWSRLKLYPGAMFTFMTRIILLIFLACLCTIIGL